MYNILSINSTLEAKWPPKMRIILFFCGFSGVFDPYFDNFLAYFGVFPTFYAIFRLAKSWLRLAKIYKGTKWHDHTSEWVLILDLQLDPVLKLTKSQVRLRSKNYDMILCYNLFTRGKKETNSF